MLRETTLDTIDAPQEQSSNRTKKVIREVVETIVLTLLIFLVVRLVVQNFRVDGFSMLPTVKNGDLVLVNKFDYMFESPQRGDIIVFHFPLNPSEDFIKRVIGVPGDTVRIKGGVGVFVDGHLLKESYIPKSYQVALPSESGYNMAAEKVPPNEYFVLGDNRNNSYDSHAWGFVPRRNIIGKALVAYWPLNNIKFFAF